MNLGLQIISGPDQGSRMTLEPGPNAVGRNSASRLVLRDGQAGWDHAIVWLEGDEAAVEDVSGAGIWLNDERIGSARMSVNVGDRLRVSPATEMEVVAGGSTAGRWRWWALGGALAAGVVLYVMIAGTFRRPAPMLSNFRYAYSSLDAWLAEAVQHRAAPRELLTRLRDAWRLDRAESYAAAARAWAKLVVAASAQPYRPAGSAAAALSWAEVAQRHPGALAGLLKPGHPQPDDGTAISALLELSRIGIRYNETHAGKQ